MFTNRSVATVVILTLVTCGIYGIYWVYVTANELQRASNSISSMDATVITVLCFFFSAIGYCLFGMNAAEQLSTIQAQRGMPQFDNKVAYIILGIFFPVILIALVQNEINKIGKIG